MITKTTVALRFVRIEKDYHIKLFSAVIFNITVILFLGKPVNLRKPFLYYKKPSFYTDL